MFYKWNYLLLNIYWIILFSNNLEIFLKKYLKLKRLNYQNIEVIVVKKIYKCYFKIFIFKVSFLIWKKWI